MPKETVAQVLEATPEPVQQVTPPVVLAEEITGLPEREEGPPMTGTMAELIAARKAKPKAAEPEDAEKEAKLDEVDKKLQQMLFKSKPKKGKEEPANEPAKPEEEPVEAAVEPVVEAKPAPAKAPAKAPVKKAPVKDRSTELREQELELDRQRLALEKERLELEKGRQPAPVQDQEVTGLSQDERYELEVFRAMDKDGNGDTAKRFLDVAKATAKYKSKWVKDHPGEAFDPEDSEHDSFFSENKFDYDKRAFRRAEARLANEGNEDPKIKELQQSNSELKASVKMRELEPVIAQAWGRFADEMVEAIDPDIVAVTRKAGAKAGEVLLKEFPEEGQEIIRAAEALGVITQEAFKILDGDGLFAPDHNNRVHARILDIIRRQEQIIPLQPKEDRVDGDGRDFATWSQWLNMTPQQQANHWHLGAEEVIDIESKNLAGRVKYELDRAMKLAEARQRRTSGGAKGGQGTPEPKEKVVEVRSPKASPGAASKTTVDTAGKTPEPAEDNISKIIRTALFKRSS